MSKNKRGIKYFHDLIGSETIDANLALLSLEFIYVSNKHVRNEL